MVLHAYTVGMNIFQMFRSFHRFKEEALYGLESIASHIGAVGQNQQYCATFLYSWKCSPDQNIVCALTILNSVLFLWIVLLVDHVGNPLETCIYMYVFTLSCEFLEFYHHHIPQVAPVTTRSQPLCTDIPHPRMDLFSNPWLSAQPPITWFSHACIYTRFSQGLSP